MSKLFWVIFLSLSTPYCYSESFNTKSTVEFVRADTAIVKLCFGANLKLIPSVTLSYQKGIEVLVQTKVSASREFTGFYLFEVLVHKSMVDDANLILVTDFYNSNGENVLTERFNVKDIVEQFGGYSAVRHDINKKISCSAFTSPSKGKSYKKQNVIL